MITLHKKRKVTKHRGGLTTQMAIAVTFLALTLVASEAVSRFLGYKLYNWDDVC
jgi:small neutral amino acid transporter SnatA (MarC family)